MDDGPGGQPRGRFALTLSRHACNVAPMNDLDMRELGKAIDRGERQPSEAVDRLKSAVVYPRFLGLDDSGSYVWELEDGRWTWGDDPDAAFGKTRTFDPEDYVVKYGTPTPLRTLAEIEGHYRVS